MAEEAALLGEGLPAPAAGCVERGRSGYLFPVTHKILDKGHGPEVRWEHPPLAQRHQLCRGVPCVLLPWVPQAALWGGTRNHLLVCELALAMSSLSVSKQSDLKTYVPEEGPRHTWPPRSRAMVFLCWDRLASAPMGAAPHTLLPGPPVASRLCPTSGP